MRRFAICDSVKIVPPGTTDGGVSKLLVLASRQRIEWLRFRKPVITTVVGDRLIGWQASTREPDSRET